MIHVIVEQSFERGPSETEMRAATQAIDSALAARGGRRLRTYVSDAHDREICELEAPDATAVQEAFRQAHSPIERMWVAEVSRAGEPTAGSAAPQASSQIPAEARSLHRLMGLWRGDGTLEVDGAPSPVQCEAHFTSTAAGLGLASEIRVKGPALPEDILISGLFGFDPGGHALHYYAVTSDGDCHDHVGNWSGPDTLRFGYSGRTAEGQGMEEDIRFSFDGPDQLTATNVTQVDGAQRFVLRAAMRR